jgi:uncharacterized protein
MSIGNDKTELATTLPLDRIAEICREHSVSELWVYGLGGEGDSQPEEEVLFLVEFHNDDFGPWGSKLDEIENDLEGVMHRKVHVASRRGIEQSSAPLRRDHILHSADLILKLDARGELAMTTATTFSQNGAALPLDRIAEICRKYQVVELSVFGSILRDDFGPESDVDFLVVFQDDDYGPWMSKLQQMQEELGALVGREVDLVPKESVQQSENWIRRRNIFDSAQVIYGS